jgi:hypothetical protein
LAHKERFPKMTDVEELCIAAAGAMPRAIRGTQISCAPSRPLTGIKN